MHKPFLTLILFFIISPSFLFAETQTIRAEYNYELGENDSQKDAKGYAFFQAKKKITLSAVRYFEINGNTRRPFISKKEMEDFIPAILEIESTGEEWRVSANKLSVSVDVKTIIDTDELRKNILNIKKDKELKTKIEKDRVQLEELEKEYEDLNRRMGREDPDDTETMLKEQQVITEKIERLERIRYYISSKTTTAKEKILMGMTFEEVIKIAGQPRATAICERPDFLNYGKVWVMLRNGVVADMIPVSDWNGPCPQYADQDVKGIKKTTDTDKAKVNDDPPRYEIIMKSGQIVPISDYYQIDDVIYYKRFGGIIGIEESKIVEIKVLDSQ